MLVRAISVQTYVIVCALLIAFTVLTVGLSFWHMPPLYHMAIGLSIALIKASLVVLFFMHAIVSPRVIWIVIAVVSFWVCILIVLTLSDYLTRGMLPVAPGH